ncbi:MAG: glycosyltransferase [Candidatus Scalindua sp. AMX11]|nr:MAG: glycosyltransferase [Candidatus Scalindua sp.]NOG82252.1 glycosyltransferase [Planctomycetota bacterium]RZV71457.1 MAG: glycosyltransferase [Candidatus Scalindua sp. SCAELEC01]TDE64279.1 MAG: glycosyltransferase [Candidatus Scalindua sp. AMX11]GJQ59918.1 MAG: succinoglycan biosynthesis protein exoa [Candidatus Scalindua sp.]
MYVSVIITCYNEERNIRECLNTLINQTYDSDKYEILVVDGCSIDGTQSIVKEFAGAHSNVFLAIEPKKGTAAGRNRGVHTARYDHIAFIDADCEAPPDWLATLVRGYVDIKGKSRGVVAVGGINIPPENSSTFLRAIGVALDSYIGSFGSVQGRQFKKPRFVASLSNLNVLYNKQKIKDIGWYDESLVSEAEDADINFRLFSAGNKFLFVPYSFVWHKMRPTPVTWLRNMFRYGKGRARLLKRYPQMWTVSFMLPLLFAASIFSLFLIPFSLFFSVPALYFPALFCFSLYLCLKKRDPTLVLHVMLVYLIQHFGYAAGEAYGLLHTKVK